MKSTLAFYKAPGLLGDKLIRFWTRSKYSHCELIINDIWYSSSMRDGGVRQRTSEARPTEHWDFIEIELSHDLALEALAKFDEIKNQPYDLFGILFSQLIKADGHDRGKWFCSEVCAYMLGLKNPHRYSPADLYRRFICK